MLYPDFSTLCTAEKLPFIADFMRNVFPGWRIKRDRNINDVSNDKMITVILAARSQPLNDATSRSLCSHTASCVRTSSFSSSRQKGSLASISFRTVARCCFSVRSWFPYLTVVSYHSVSKLSDSELTFRIVLFESLMEGWLLTASCRIMHRNQQFMIPRTRDVITSSVKTSTVSLVVKLCLPCLSNVPMK